MEEGQCALLLSEEQKNMDIDLGWDDASEDAYLNDIMKNEIGTLDENPFDFNNWWPLLVEPRQSTSYRRKD
jgi:hypothetical protein